jgi:hypothetical protein
VVLRGFEAASRTLRMHTDARSGKAAELARDARCALHLYDAGAKLQLRLSGHATLHAEDAVAEQGWANSRDFSRMCYAIEPAPGTPIVTPPPVPRDAAAGRGALEIRMTGPRLSADLPGGRLELEWPGAGSVFMTGPAEEVFEGIWYGD